MPRHSNAIGYILELRDDVNQGWFTKLCDIALLSPDGVLNQNQIDEIIDLFFNITTYTSSISLSTFSTTLSSITATIPAGLRIDYIKNFQNFKLLSPNLNIKTDKLITIIFGANATGKSSISESFKILSNIESPSNTLENVRIPSTTTSSFEYNLNGEPTPRTWNSSLGFGLLANNIKFFDSSISVRNVNSALQPQRIVEISPFKLHIFEYLQNFIAELRQSIDSKLSANIASLNTEIEKTKRLFSNTKNPRISIIENFSVDNYTDLQLLLNSFESKDFNSEIQKLNDELSQLLQSSSEQAIKILKTEIHSIKAWIAKFEAFLKIINEINLTEIIQVIKLYIDKYNNQKKLAELINPDEIEFENFKSFLISSKSFYDFDIEKNCPYCKQPIIIETSKELIKKYSEFLNSNLESEIQVLADKINIAKAQIDKFKTYNVNELNIENDFFDENFISELMSIITDVQNKIPSQNEIRKIVEIDNSLFSPLIILNEKLNPIRQELLKKQDLLNKVSGDKETLDTLVNTIKQKISNFEFELIIATNHTEFCSLITGIISYQNLLSTYNSISFRSILLKTSNKSKDTNSELIVSAFEQSFDSEYYLLTERHLVDIGLSLQSNVKDISNIFVNPKIGNKPIQTILSEGEQKVHALALFFCELRYSKENVIILDDPVTSLDYNYVGSFCERFKNYILSNRTKQYIIFTHDWEFFMQLQDSFNKAGLNNDYSLYVLEDCAICEQYSEKIDELKAVITTILAQSSINNADKERLAGNMRRLIESIINIHCFNGQRYQYKKKKMQVSVFTNYEKLVRLLPTESVKFRDLYSKLSITEHDDPRDCYINQPKTVFQNRFDEIILIENAIKSRK